MIARSGLNWSRPASKPPSALTTRGGRTSPPREILAYRSSLLAGLPGHLRAPRVLRIEEGDDGNFWLWLEAVSDAYGRRWPLAQLGLAARHLGAFNGAYLVSRALPTEPWLNGWLARRRTGSGPSPEDMAEFAVRLRRDGGVGGVRPRASA